MTAPLVLALLAALALVAACGAALAVGAAALRRVRDDLARSSADAVAAGQQQLLQQAGATFELAQQRTQQAIAVSQAQMDALVAPLREQVRALSQQHGEIGGRLGDLGQRTAALTQVLGSRPARGQWGEDNLRRLVHLAGLTEGVHVEVQPTFEVDGRTVRPDLLVHLAADEVVIVDAKAPLDAFQRAVGTHDRADALRHEREHASALRAHVRALGRKPYARAVPHALDFVVLYLPYEGAIDLAHQHDAELFDLCVAQKVHLATPHTLIALLSTVALGWRQRRLAESAEEIVRLGTRLYERLGVVASHVAAVGRGIEQAGAAYNRAVGSIEANLLATARELHALGVAAADAPAVAPVEFAARPFAKPDLLGEDDAA